MNLCSAHNPPLPPVFLLRRLEKTGKRNEIFHATTFGLAGGEWGMLMETGPEYVYATSNEGFVEVGDRIRPLLPSTCRPRVIGEVVKLVK